MSSRRKAANWLEQVANLLKGSRNGRRPSVRRRLVAERLERRTVLTAMPPLADLGAEEMEAAASTASVLVGQALA